MTGDKQESTKEGGTVSGTVFFNPGKEEIERSNPYVPKKSAANTVGSPRNGT